jgi:hypothetical protein
MTPQTGQRFLGEGTLIEVVPDPGCIRTLVERERDFRRHALEDRRPQPQSFER